MASIREVAQEAGVGGDGITGAERFRLCLAGDEKEDREGGEEA